MNIFHRYIVREHVAPFFFAFSVIMFVLILKFMLQTMDMLISKGVGIVIVAQLIVYNLAWMVALVVPMSVLVASVMAFGRMGAHGEIIAMKTGGISMYRIVSPVLLLSILLTIVMIWFNNIILPEANYRGSSLFGAVKIKKSMLLVKENEGQFVSHNDIPFTFTVEEVDDSTDEMKGVTIFKHKGIDSQTIIIAEKGKFFPSSDCITLVLKNGEIHQRDSSQPERYIRSTFDQFTYLIKGLAFGLDNSYKSIKSDRTMTSDEMHNRIKEIQVTITGFENRIAAIPEDNPGRDKEIATIAEHKNLMKRQIARYLVEIHKKNSIPFASIVFVLIGASLGMLIRRSGASIGIGMSIGFFMLYYIFLIGGESAGDRMIVDPWLAMWAPNIVLGTVGTGLFIHAARR
ncbi:LptF/LptG family permease [Candidatus Latescibacterota bacterium]